jgi:repressor LexA
VNREQRDRKLDVLRFVNGFFHENGYGPTYDEIRAAVGLCSKSHASYYLGILERDGLVERKPYSPRGLRVTGLPQHAGDSQPSTMSQ